MKLSLGALQQLGRALMLPIAVLPVAALMLRLGQPDLLGAPGLADVAGGAFGLLAQVFAAAGGAVFGHLGLIFAIGVAVGLARENHGAAGLAGVICFLVTTEGAKVLLAVPPDVVANAAEGARDLAGAAWREKEIGKLGIPAGILSGVIGGVFYNRFSDIRLPDYLAFFGGRRFVPIVSGLAGVGLALAFGIAWPVLERGMDGLSAGILGLGPLGLFLYGLLNRLLIITGLHHILNNLAWFLVGDFNGVTGDLNRFAAGDPSAGAFMSGFFPVMMFGLPAACLAMYHTARPERRKAVGGMLSSLALTSVLTGVSMALMAALDVHLGFGFSAGLFDYVLNFNKATRPWLLIPVGLGYAAIYYGIFRFAILRFDLKTPGRESDDAAVAGKVAAGPRGPAFVTALGGAANLASVDACTTRLRLEVRDQARVDEPALRALGARGLVRPGDTALQVVLGPQADQVAGEIRAAMHAGEGDGAELVQLLNAVEARVVHTAAGRVVLQVSPDAALNLEALSAHGARGAWRRGAHLHLVFGAAFAADADRLAAALPREP